MIVRLKGVKIARAKGRVYYYHRKTMTRLPGQPGSAEFIAALRSLEARKGSSIPGTFGGLVRAYKTSPEFIRLAKGTKHQYQFSFDALADLDDVSLSRFTTEFIFKVRDKLALRSRSTANVSIKILRLLFTWGSKRGYCRGNPAAAVDPVRRPRDAKVVNRPWHPDELATVLAEGSPELCVGVALGAFAGLREGDVIAVTWACYDGTAIETRTQKTRQRVWIPAIKELRAVLDAAPRIAETIVAGARGHSLTSSGFRSLFFRTIRRLTEAGKVKPGLSFHGLRHTFATRLAEAGCDAGTIAAVLGHSNARMSEHYARHADRDHLAAEAIERLSNPQRKTFGKPPLKLLVTNE